MLPKKTKYKKNFKGVIRGNDFSKYANKLQYGFVGLQALENGRITAKHIEAIRRIVIRKTNRVGKLWLGIFPNIPVTKKPQEVRMGKGKGDVYFWTAKVKTHRVLVELIGVPQTIAKEALFLAMNKIPLKTRLIFRE